MLGCTENLTTTSYIVCGFVSLVFHFYYIESLYSLFIFTEIVFLADWWSSSTCAILTDDKTWEKMGKEHAIVLMNHSDEVDWLMGWLVCEQTRLIAVSQIWKQRSLDSIDDMSNFCRVQRSL